MKLKASKCTKQLSDNIRKETNLIACFFAVFVPALIVAGYSMVYSRDVISTIVGVFLILAAIWFVYRSTKLYLRSSTFIDENGEYKYDKEK